jgi:hypothetical protein
VCSVRIQHESTINVQSRSNRLHSTISAAVHCINPVPIHYHKKWPERNKQPANQLGVRPFPFHFYQQLIDVNKPQPLLKLLLKLLLLVVNWELLLVVFWELQVE